MLFGHVKYLYFVLLIFFMLGFLKMFLASLLSIIVFAVLCFILLIGIATTFKSSDTPDIGSNAVLLLDLSKEIKEQAEQNAFNSISGNSDNDLPGLYQVIRLIRHAKTDSAIKGIYIKCEENSNGFAASEELRNALIDFKSSHKFIIAYGDVISQKAYYVANVADKVYCNPQGSLDWRGFSSNLYFLKGMLEKLEIEPQIFYAGKFKSATEPLRAYEMTPANRLQTSVYLNDLYSHLLLSAAERSGLDTATLHGLANNGSIQTAADAAKYKLIDAVKYDDEVKDEIIRKTKTNPAKKINFVSLGKYAKGKNLLGSGEDRIAIIYAEGEINEGKNKEGKTIGSDETRNLIRNARLDEDIKAIVFRVNSPGGSSLASEEIWREIVLAKKVKPVVVSFGDVAASGGYYISCGADSIFAQPNTITGSIGVFGIIPNFKKFFNNKMGVTFDGVKTGPFADMPSVNRPLNAAESMFIQNTIDTIYHTFKNRVSEGRRLSMDVVDSIAQGRVWTGQRALELGLVDRLGNISDAIKCAAGMAKITEYRLQEYPEKKGFLQSIISNFSADVKAHAIQEEIGEEQYKMLQQIKNVKAMTGIPQTRLPFEFDIR